MYGGTKNTKEEKYNKMLSQIKPLDGDVATKMRLQGKSQLSETFKNVVFVLIVV